MSLARVCLALLVAAPAAVADTPPGFTPLFNGKDLTGWHGWAIHSKGGTPADMAKLSPEEKAKKVADWTADAKKHWSVQNGELVNDGFGAYLASDKELRDYELLIEYKTVPKADSGIYLKATPQVQIWDTTEADPQGLGKALGSGGLWNNSKGAAGKDPLVKADNPLGEWNAFRIIQVGERTTIFLNGKLVVENARLENYWSKKAPLPVAGPILLQTHGGEIRWRNIAYREIPPAEANKLLAAKPSDGFVSIFDGKSFDGWTGATNEYDITDGAIVCKPKKGGNLYTKATYTDFVAQVEYKLPPGGNNGLAIRYPGTGDPSVTGMCEVQILDDTDAKKYAKLDPRQYNGSAYGMIPAARGYLRPVGEWNIMTVTAQGPRITVELNGSRITDGDLSQVTEYMGGKPHPGKLLPGGHFGFAGHSDPVAFRNIMIKTLK